MSVSTALSGCSYEKVLVLFGSPHKDGNTAKLLHEALENLPEESEIETFYAYDQAVKPCFGCNICKSGICVYDDLDELRQKIEECDLLIVASPVYNFSVPSPLKAVLDRFQIYWAQRFLAGIRVPIKKHRDAWVVLTCGSKDEKGIADVTGQLDMIFTVMNTKRVNLFKKTATDLKSF